MLLPTLLLWLWEERLRTQELQFLIRQQQQQQEQELQQQGRERLEAGQLALGAKPTTMAAVLGWFAGTVWLLWLVLEAVML